LYSSDTNDKHLAILEGDHEGKITCITVSDDGRILITGGVDTVVGVYKVSRITHSRKFEHLSNLSCHQGAITCLAVSRSYSIIVSGSEDKTCVIWDLNRLLYLRQLPKGSCHEQPISSVAINDITGEIATCSGTIINIWSVNGELLISKKNI